MERSISAVSYYTTNLPAGTSIKALSTTCSWMRHAPTLRNASARYSLRPDFLPSPTPSAFSILDNIRIAKNIHNNAFYHHMALCLNALATSSRIRHFDSPTITECAFCGHEEDSLYHIYARCDVVAAARCLLSSQQSLVKCPVREPSLNLLKSSKRPRSNELPRFAAPSPAPKRPTRSRSAGSRVTRTSRATTVLTR